MGLRLGCMVGILAALAAPVEARTPAAPVQLLLRIESTTLIWEIAASGDARIVASHWKTTPAALWSAAPFETLDLAAGETVRGRVALAVDADWIDARLVVRDGGGEWTVGASTRSPAARPDPPLPVTPVSKSTAGSSGWVRGTFHYEDRWLDARGYRGDVQRLPLRFVDADLVTSDGRIVARSALDASGSVRLGPIPDGTGPVRIRVASSIHRHPTWRMDVVEPRTPQSGLDDVQAHHLETVPVVVEASEVDLGTIVARDPDGFGRVQAFHILDNAVDVWEALADPTWVGSSPGVEDSLRILWGPTLRVRGSAYGRGLIEIASPASGDTDGWSDAVILHEIGHFIVDTFLRDDTPGGAHLLGDVHQDPRLAYSEGLASAFACWVRARRLLVRRNVDAAPMDGEVNLFVNAGMPPPDGQPGGLQYAWDVEAHTLGGAPLVREGIESETNLAGVWLDLVDTSSSEGVDDDRARAPVRAVFDACRTLRQLPRGVGATFEDFYRAWIATENDAEFSILRRDARIEYELDLAEPDVAPRQPPSLWSSMAHEPEGGVVIAEIWTAPAVAVELVNRSAQTVAIGGWQLLARSNDSSQNPSLTYTIPSGVGLGPGARLLVVKSGRPSEDRATQLHAPGWTVPWFPGFDGALGLRDAAGRGVDFVRWDARNGGAPSRVTPIPGTSWNGTLPAALPGHSLARRDRGDRDHADEFTDAEPTPGGPNGAPGVHRTFFPAADVDRLQWWIPEDGTYTIQARRMRSGALPEIEVALPNTPERVVRAVADHPRGDTRITLALRAGDTIEARFRHVGNLTQLGSYDVAAWRETDARIALPPAGITIEVAPGTTRRQVVCSWWNAAQYDSICVRVAEFETCLAGNARETHLSLPEGRHDVEIAGWARGVRAAAPRLTVAVEDWPAHFSDGFDTWPTLEWETSGWATIPVAGRGQVLTDSPTGDYADDRTTTVRLRTAIVPSEGTVLRFSHVCAVRPEDGAWVEVSTDWGATWSPLGRYDWNDRPRETGDWRDGELEDGDWSEESLSLGAFAGRPTQIRFRLASDIYAHADGWYLDALKIDGTVPPPRFALRLSANVPNPFNPTTQIHFDISHPAHVVLRILDVRGRWVRTLLDAPTSAGAHAVEWDGRDMHGRSVASGVYVSELRGLDTRAARTLVLIR